MKTTPVTYVGHFDEVEIAATGQICKQGQTINVDADLAESLIEQEANWAPGAPKKTATTTKDGDA